MDRYLLVAVFGALGAVSRYAIDGWVSDATRGQFPWGTLVVNVMGSFGSFTTFSTFAYETVKLTDDGGFALSVASVGAMLVLGLSAAAAGLAVGRAL